jgi:putative ABC transport system substrate-binding protein
MRKRVICFALSAVLFALCLPAEAQQGGKVPLIGYLQLSTGPGDSDERFRQGLRELGWVDGQNIKIEYRWAGNKADRLPALAQDLVSLKVDIIVAWATPIVQAVKNATSTIPIVMYAADPVGTGLVAGLAQPGGNITGVSMMAPELEGKRLELLREILPKISRVAFLAYRNDPAHTLFIKEAQELTKRIGMQFQPLVIGEPDEIESALSAAIRERAGALMVQPILVGVLRQGSRIAELAIRNRLPTFSNTITYVNAGGLLSYGADREALQRRIPHYVDKILKGRKPADLPVEQPMKFELVINLKTAKQIGVTISPSVLFQATRVIK